MQGQPDLSQQLLYLMQMGQAGGQTSANQSLQAIQAQLNRQRGMQGIPDFTQGAALQALAGQPVLQGLSGLPGDGLRNPTPPEEHGLKREGEPLDQSPPSKTRARGKGRGNAELQPAGSGLSEPGASDGGGAAAEDDAGGDDGRSGAMYKNAKEKNRQAQRRFRERQKALISNLKDKAATLDKRVDEQACVIQGLKEENHMLRLLLAEKACVPQTQMLSQLQAQGGVSQAMLAASTGMPASAGLNHEAALQAAKQQLRGQELPRKPSPGSSQ